MVVDDESALMAALGAKEVKNDAPPTDTPPPAESTPPTDAAPTPSPPPPAEEIVFGKAESTPPPTDAAPVFNSKEVLGVELPLEDIKTRLNKWDEVQKELTELKNKNPFANDKVKAYNEAMLKNVSEEAFFKVHGVDVEKLTPLEKVVTQLMWEKGLSEDKAKMLANHKYSLDVVADELATDAEKAAVEKTKSLAQLQLEMDAKDASVFLSQFKTKTLDAPLAAEPVSDASEAWKPHVGEIMKDFALIKFGSDFSYNVPKEAIAEAMADVLGTLKAIGEGSLPTNPKDVETVRGMVSTTIKASQFDNVVKSLQAHYGKKLIDFKNNPSGLKSEADVVRQNGSGNTDAMIKEMHAAGY